MKVLSVNGRCLSCGSNRALRKLIASFLPFRLSAKAQREVSQELKALGDRCARCGELVRKAPAKN